MVGVGSDGDLPLPSADEMGVGTSDNVTHVHVAAGPVVWY